MFLLSNKDESENNSQDTSVYNEITSWQKYFNTTCFWKLLKHSKNVHMLLVLGVSQKIQLYT